ncbi:putative transposase (plasmid) [Acetobacter pasteurianus 386B]|nr:putative transposase [Acetobacter pasteurianus 386B]
MREECLNETLFTSLSHVRQVLADWREDYNTMRPHSQLDCQDTRSGRQTSVSGAYPRDTCHPTNPKP